VVSLEGLPVPVALGDGSALVLLDQGGVTDHVREHDRGKLTIEKGHGRTDPNSVTFVAIREPIGENADIIRAMPSRKLMAGAVGVILFAVGAATAPADGPPVDTTTTAVTSTTTPVATASTTPSTTATTAPVTTTAPTTTVPVVVPPAAPKRLGPAATVRQRSLAVGCPVAAVVLVLPHRGPLVVGSFASAASRRAGSAKLVYRAGGGIVTGSAATLTERGCTSSGPASARATMASVSLLGGAVTAARVSLTRSGVLATTVSGLAVEGTRVSLRSGARVAVPGFGYVSTGPGARVPVSRGVVATAALALHLTSAHAGLPAGTVVLVSAIGLPVVVPHVSRAKPRAAIRHVARKHVAKTTHRRRRRKHPAAPKGQPLTVTPPLALDHYDFPVAGPSDFGDSYGGYRSDVPGNWHHGDDIFAALGTPVVAVASGTINRVGWEKLGGWRLWVRDDGGDEFYYAHLSGYAPGTLHSNRVKAGQVIGFVGNTGDAFTTSPHLHFEIHPRQLLHLQYNGAVDPTTYLDHWTHLARVVVPKPAHPALPRQPQLRKEARYVFRELLVARHLVRHRPSAKERPRVRIPLGAKDAAPRRPRPKAAHVSAAAPLTQAAGRTSSSSSAALRILGALLGACAIAGVIVLLRRRPSGG
jgi:murein DD-endopeptidase MepM/ murein hydrolase activator NlpD